MASSESERRQAEAQLLLNVGVELECVGTGHNISHQAIRQHLHPLAKQFPELLRGVTANLRWAENTLNITDDFSIDNTRDEHEQPLVKPGLRIEMQFPYWNSATPSGPSVLSTALDLLSRHSSFNFYCNRSCGLHLHLSPVGRSWDLDELKRLVAGILSLETRLNQYHPHYRVDGSNPTLQPVSGNGKFLRLTLRRRLKLVASVNTVAQLIALVNPDDERSHRYNLRAMERYGTVEFRQHKGSLSAPEVLRWVRIVSHFVNTASRWPLEAYLENNGVLVEDLFRFLVLHPEIQNSSSSIASRSPDIRASKANSQHDSVLERHQSVVETLRTRKSRFRGLFKRGWHKVKKFFNGQHQ